MHRSFKFTTVAMSCAVACIGHAQSLSTPQATYLFDEALGNLSGRLKLLPVLDNYYSSKATAWVDAARTELSLSAVKEVNQKIVNDAAYNAEQIIMAIEAGQTGFKQVPLPKHDTKHPVLDRSKELLRLYEFKNCLTPLRGHFEVALAYAQTAPDFELAYSKLVVLNQRVIADQRTSCAEFVPIIPTTEALAIANIKQAAPLSTMMPATALVTVLATRVPDEYSVFLNGDIASMLISTDSAKDWYEAINEALIPNGYEMKFDVSKRSLHLGPFTRTAKNDVPSNAFSVNTLLAHWAGKSNMVVTTEGALIDYALTQKVRKEDYADDVRIAVQQLLAFYKTSSIPIHAEVREASIHISNQPKVTKVNSK
jgi:hypothetical protein